MNKLINTIENTVEQNDSTDFSGILTEGNLVDGKQTIEVIIVGEYISIRPILEEISKLREWCVRDVDLKSEFNNNDKLDSAGVVLLCYRSKSKHHIFYRGPDISEDEFYNIRREHGFCLVAYDKQKEEVVTTADDTHNITKNLDNKDYNPENTIIFNTGNEYYH